MDSSQLAQLVAKVLKEELREDGNTREQSLEQFRDWIRKNPDIQNCPTDDSFLLPYLRVRKYSVPMAENTLMRLLKFQHNFPELNWNLDIEDPDINDIVSSGFHFASPFRDGRGPETMFLIPRNLDFTKHTYASAMRAILLNVHALERTESTLVLGLSNIFDLGNVPPAIVTFAPIAVIRALMENLEKSIAIRSKQWHVINISPITAMLLKSVMSALNEKIQKRFMVHSSLEELHKHVDPSVLPKEYGGTMPMEEMLGLWKKELAVHREAVLAVNNIKLVGDSFKNDLGSNETGTPDLQGSFRKLDVD